MASTRSPILDLDDLAKKLKENTWIKRTRPYGPTPQWPSSPWWDNYPGYPSYPTVYA